jgi:DNA-binding NtrC family response regulator
VGEQLENLVLHMFRSGSSYSEAVREFHIVVLRELKGNQVRAARHLGMHRNTLRRTLQAFGIDVDSGEAVVCF